MKYIIPLLLIAYNIHAGQCLSGTKAKRMPLQYLHVTPTLQDEEQASLFTGKYSYVHYNDDILGRAERPVWKAMPNDTYAVDVQSEELLPSDTPLTHGTLKNILAFTWNVFKIAPDGTQTIEATDSMRFPLQESLEKTISLEFKHLTLKFLISRTIVTNK